jgi:hypothetical protein
VIENLCFVQFLHPGAEPGLRTAGEMPWNTGARHKRKFLRAPGAYRLAAEGKTVRSREVDFWGEWEPQSTVEPVVKPQPGGPRWVHRPFYDPPSARQWVQNTDPFVFGPQFLYTGCQQHRQARPTQLAKLRPGSLLLFGSARGRRFRLDTVFVVGEKAIDHARRNRVRRIGDAVPDAYWDITLNPWYAGHVPVGQIHRLYFGATPEQPVNGMFSFFPCRPLDADPDGFARPEIRLPGYVTPTQTQSFRRTLLAGGAEAEGLWRKVVAQVLKQDLVLGVRADMPKRKNAKTAPAGAARRAC